MLKIKLKMIAVLLVVISTATIAQTSSGREQAEKILDKAIGEVFASESIGISFEGIAYGINKPEDIFTLPVYKVYRGGYLFVNKDKYKVELGLMKSVSDGNVTVMVDEQSKTMIVDSVRKEQTAGTDDISALINEDFKESTLEYLGEVMINNHKCYKIISHVKGEKTATEVGYWVDVASGQLYLMSEKQNDICNVYWFGKVGKAPEGYNYTVFLPKKQLTTFHGYTVVDNRFSEIN